ncbi:hypothetical protein MJH96_20590, partial [Salmonella enterica subsp. enterica serovar Kentucky]|nr:hypothetical protein [Salmonella enterica subsp. enterica serovar Kentucky]
MDTKKIFKHIPWVILGIIGAFCLSVVALRRGEHVSALWIVVASVSVYLVAYRYYSLYIAQKVMKLDPTRATPAVINNDGLNYVPTNRYVLFGHHFAAIAGAGPLVGPVLAAQMGYLPGTLWLLAGVVLAGAVQDFMADAFGQHYCDERLFNDEVDQTELFEQCQRYYANILTPFSRLVT